MADSSYYQGEYIRHPVLYELSHKYGLQTESVPEAALPNKLEELKELIRREIRKELKIKEGAEKLREASKDRKSLSDVAHIVKKSNSKLSELHAELQELESQIILTQGQGEPPKNGHDCIVSSMSGLNVDSQGNNFSTDLRLVSLEKQLNIELKVKQGAENMLQSLANSGHSRDKKLIGEAQQMLLDSKAKIEYLKMRIMKVRQNRGAPRGNDNLPNGDVNNKGRTLEPPALEDRVDELRHRLRIEAAVVEGAKNVIRLLQSSKVADKKALQEAGNIVLTANEGPSRDSGYSSEHMMSPRGVGARATCSVTVAGHHTVTLTCSEIPEQVTNPGTTLVPQTVHFCHHPPPEKPHRHFHPHPTPPTPASQQAPSGPQTPQQVSSGPPTPQQESLPPLPVLKDAASQTSSTNVPQVVQEHTKKRKSRPYHRSPARARGSPIGQKSTASSGESDGKKNPRTVHIDVYCTGSESDGSSSSEEEDTNTNSTPQTVFESNKVKVMHSRAHSDSLPHALQRQKRRVLSNSRLDILPKEASGSTISSSYPSPRSSLVSNTTGGFSLASESTLSSRFSSVNNSSVTTSWKDTDLESTQASLLKSDSFDYENSFDKLRIKEKERVWGSTDRPKRFYKRALPANSNSSDSTDEDEEGLAWSFGRYEDIQKRHLKREETVRHHSHTSSEAPCMSKADHGQKQAGIIKQIPSSLHKSGSLSDSEASNLKKLKNGSTAGRLPPAYPFQHWAKAERFGPLVSSLKKPGHHVGPSKNPDCSCETCKYIFEHICYRNRTRSLGDKPPS